MNDEDLSRLNTILRPVAPPQVLENVYTDDQYARLLDVIKRNGPWPTITAHHFNTVEELMATSNGGLADNFELTLDDMATGHFRGILGENSVPYFPRSRIASTTASSFSSCVRIGARCTRGRR